MITRLIEVVCSYCQKSMGSKVSEWYDGQVMVSHGMCAQCAAFVEHEARGGALPPGTTFADFEAWRANLTALQERQARELARIMSGTR